MPIEQVNKAMLAVSADADHHVRQSIKGTEDEINRIIEDINSKAIFPDIDTGAIAAPGDVSSPGNVTVGGYVASTGNISSSAAISGVGSIAAHTGTAIPVGGAAGKGVLVSSVANFGLFFGSGAPAISAAKGSLYMRSDGTGTADRMYVNVGGTTWTAVNTVA